jgi:hypothetical protein
MRKGRINLSPELIEKALDLPPDWQIESLSFIRGIDTSIIATISGSSFPEHKEGELPKKCVIIVHDKQREFEVKEIA